MNRVHVFEFVPKLIGGRKRYLLELAENEKPVVFRTMTTPMYSLYGEVVEIDGSGQAGIQTAYGVLRGPIAGPMRVNRPAYAIEHLDVYGNLGVLVSYDDFREGGINFVNFGVPNGKHIRIDFYTGESRIIDG